LFSATQIRSNNTCQPHILQYCGVCILSQNEHGTKEISTDTVFRLCKERGL
jgi:hypothetical protein